MESTRFSTTMSAQGFHQAYGFKLYFQLIKASLVDLDLLLPNAGFGVGKFMSSATLMPNANTVLTSGDGDTYKVFSGTPKAITRAAVATNVVTLTFGAAHGITQGSTIIVKDLPAPFAGLNGVFTVASVTTSTPFTLTYALDTANITDAAVAAGTAMSGVLALDGTDPPVRLLGLTNCSPTEGENEETTVTYDNEAKGFDTSMATSSSISWTVAGQTRYADAAYRLMRIASRDKVRAGLMIKYLVLGPVNVNKADYGFGRFQSFEEPREAGTIIKYNTGIRGYGPYETDG
jgi:hypothetical protein